MAKEVEQEEVVEETNTLSDESLYDMSDDEFEAAMIAAESGAPAQVEDNNDEKDVESTTDDEELEVEVDEDNDENKEDEDLDLEQPEKDSDDDSEADEEEADSDEDSDKDEPTGDSEEEQTEEDDGESKAEAQPAQKLVYKANGEEFEFTEDEVKAQFGDMFAKAMNYTQKMQAFAPYKGMLATIKEQGLTQEDLNLMTDVLKSDKTAAAALLKRVGIDALDIEPEVDSTYQPNDYGRSDAELRVQEVTEAISSQPGYDTTMSIIGQEWDDTSRDEMVKDPELIKLLQVDVQNGVYNAVKPLMSKLKTYDGGRKSDLEYYKAAGAQYLNGVQAQEQRQKALEAKEAEIAAKEAKLAKIEAVKAKEARRVANAKASKKRKAAATTKSRVSKPDALDYINMDAMTDEEFSAFMDKHSK